MNKKDKNDLHQNQGEEWQAACEKMVHYQIERRGISDKRVLDALRKVPRHKFISAKLFDEAYNDSPLPIGHKQTISQPYIVALMTEKLELVGDERVLEVGTGSGYQAAILAELAKQVYTIEIVNPLCKQAAKRLKEMEYTNVKVRCGDGYSGWPEAAPFDAIIVTAAPDHVPQPLINQLKKGGRMILPVGEYYQELVLITKNDQGQIKREAVTPVRFVPMTGEAEDH